MNVNSYGSLASLPAAMSGVGEQPATGAAGFGKVIQRFIQDTNTQQLQADRSVELLATGQSDSVHGTMLALTKADLSLRLFMEVRNKVIEAYQEVMRMQL